MKSWPERNRQWLGWESPFVDAATSILMLDQVNQRDRLHTQKKVSLGWHPPTDTQSTVISHNSLQCHTRVLFDEPYATLDTFASVKDV